MILETFMKKALLALLVAITTANTAYAYGMKCENPHLNGRYEVLVVDDLGKNAFLFEQNYYKGQYKNFFSTRLSNRKTEAKAYTYNYTQNTLPKSVKVQREGAWIVTKSLGAYSTSIWHEKNCTVLSKSKEKELFDIFMKEHPLKEEKKTQTKF